MMILLKKEAPKKNIYLFEMKDVDLIPFFMEDEKSRVHLQDASGTDYFNANFIKVCCTICF